MNSKYVKSFFYLSVSIFLFIFVWVFYNVLLANVYGDFNPLTVITGALSAIIIFRLLFIILNKADERFYVKNEKKILLIYFICFFISQLIIGTMLSITPLWDLEMVYDGAKNLVFYGNLGDYTEYFEYHPHTWGGLLILYVPFKIFSVFGFPYDSYAYYFLGMLLNILLMDISIYCAYQVLKIHLNIKKALFSLIIVLFLPSVFVFLSPVFYSDTLSMFAPISVYYLYLKQQSAEKKNYLFFIAMGAITGIGFLIKGTPVMMMLAIIINILFTLKKGNLKKSAINVAAFVFVTLATIYAVRSSVYVSKIVDRQLVDKHGHTISFYIMMGLTGNGGYSHSEFEFARSIEDPVEREERQIEVIKQRIADYKTKGLILFFTNKCIYTWGDGTYELHNFLDDNPLFPNALHEIILQGGKHNENFLLLSQFFHVAVLFFVICCLYYTVKYKLDYNLPIIYSFIAVFLFFLVYESKSRIYINYFPVIIVMITDGISRFSNSFEEWLIKSKKRPGRL